MTGTEDRLLALLKTDGPQRAADLAARLGITPAGIRQHLARLSIQGLVRYDVVIQGRGKPKYVWTLTQDAQARFPDRHADMTLLLIDGIRRHGGDQALDAIIDRHAKVQSTQYRELLADQTDAAGAVGRLAEARSRDGYMAEAVRDDDGTVRLIENHCPICAAASLAQGFCRAELSIFRDVLNRFGTVDREDHLIAGARRCSYRLTPHGATSRAK